MRNVKQVLDLKWVSTFFVALAAMVLLFSCNKNADELPARSATVTTDAKDSQESAMRINMKAVPFQKTVYVPCANGGAGENVELSGNTNFVYQMTWTDHGFTLVYHANHQNVTGVGLTSGERFVGSGVTNGTVMGAWVNNSWVATTNEQMRVVGQNTNFIVKYQYHLTVTPDGNITASIKEVTAECK